jgi:hypothetical protein
MRAIIPEAKLCYNEIVTVPNLFSPVTDFKITVGELTEEGYPLQAQAEALGLTAEGVLPRGWPENRSPGPTADLGVLHQFSEQQLIEWGTANFEAVFRDGVRDAYRSIQAQLPGQPRLRILLDIQPKELRGIPWEMLYDPWRKQFVGYRDGITLVRYVGLAQARPLSPVTGGLRVLVVIAQPQGLQGLDSAAERSLIESAFKGRPEEISLEFVGGKVSQIRPALAKDPDVLHFISHGYVDETIGPCLLLEQENGDLLQATQLVIENQLLAALPLNPRLRLIVLNGCQTSQEPSHAGFDSLAYALARQIDSVVAMQYPVSDRNAQAFAGALYRNLAISMPLDVAVTSARQELIRDSTAEDVWDWLAPVLVSGGQGFVLGKQAVLETLANLYEHTGQGLRGMEFAGRLEVLKTVYRRHARQLLWSSLWGGTLGAVGFACVTMYNWYHHKLTAGADALTWITTLPAALLVFFLTFPGAAFMSLCRDLAYLFCGGRHRLNAAWGTIAGGVAGTGLSMFLLSGLTQLQGGSAEGGFDWSPTYAGGVLGGLMAAAWLPGLFRRWRWMSYWVVPLMGGAWLYVIEQVLDWWPDTSYYLTPFWPTQLWVVGGLLGFFAGLGLTVSWRKISEQKPG